MHRPPSHRFHAPGRILHGPGALAELPALLSSEARHLVVTDAGVAAAGIAERLAAVLRRARIAFTLFDRVHADPAVPVVEEAVALAREKGCRAVIGLGGGSAIDAAKAVATRLARATPLRRYGDGLEVPAPIASLHAIPTTAGTGSEVTRVAVITDPERNEKMAIRGACLVPQAAVLDPELLATLPPPVAAECGADALTHAVEACVSRQASPLTDTLALAAVELIAGHLRRLVRDPADLEAAERMLLAANLAGQAFTHAGLGLVHSLGEPLGAFHHTSHGLSCAIFLPVVMEFNLPAAPSLYARIARALGEDTRGLAETEAAALAVAAVRRLFADVGLPAGYREAGVDFTLRPEMIAQVPPQLSTRCNPRAASEEEIRGLFEAPGRS